MYLNRMYHILQIHLDEVLMILLQLNQFADSVQPIIQLNRKKIFLTNRSVFRFTMGEIDKKSFPSVSIVSNKGVFGVFH